MDQLFEEINFMIFNHFSVQELINLKLVNKRFNQLINLYLNYLTELVIKRSYEYYNEDNEINSWYFCDKPIKLNTILFIPHERFYNLFLNFKLLFNNFGNQLKYLKINLNGCAHNFDLNQLNYMPKLEHLQIDGKFDLASDCVLDLLNLKILKILHSNYLLTINSNKLKHLNCYFLKDIIKIIKPESIVSIEVYQNRYENLSEFTNLEYYHCNTIEGLNSNFLLSIPKSLKKIKLFLTNYSIIIGFGFDLNIKDILELRVKLNLIDLKIYLQNVELEFNLKFNEQTFTNDYRLKKYEFLFNTNYDRLDSKIDSLKQINYSKLIKLFDLVLPLRIQEKLTNIQIVQTNSVIDQDEFIIFLERCSNIFKLKLKNTNLDQQFFDRLPNLCKLLENLKLFDHNEYLNYEFLNNFKLIRKITISNLPIETAIDNLTKLKSIYKLKFEINNYLIKMRKVNLFEIEYRNKEWLYSNLDDVIKLLKNIYLKNESLINELDKINQDIFKDDYSDIYEIIHNNESNDSNDNNSDINTDNGSNIDSDNNTDNDSNDNNSNIDSDNNSDMDQDNNTDNDSDDKKDIPTIQRKRKKSFSDSN